MQAVELESQTPTFAQLTHSQGSAVNTDKTSIDYTGTRASSAHRAATSA